MSLTPIPGFNRRVAVLAAVLLAFVAVDSHGSITVTKTNNTGATVDNSSVDQTVSFTAADFGGGDTTIGKITVTIDFSKLSVGPLFKPGFDEVEFTLTGLRDHDDHTHVEKIDLIQRSDFTVGDDGTSFNGTITFDMDATDLVNVDPDQIQAGTFIPNDDLGIFIGSDAARDWTLTILDDKDTADGNTPLVVNSWSVSITTAATAVPEPDSIGLWGMAALLASLIVFHRPRRRADSLPTA